MQHVKLILTDNLGKVENQYSYYFQGSVSFSKYDANPECFKWRRTFRNNTILAIRFPDGR